NIVDPAAIEAKLAALADGTADFENTPDTDPDLPGNRAWGREIVNKMVASTLGKDAVAKAMIHTEDELNQVVETAVAASASWQAMGAAARAAILHRAGAA